MTLHLPVWLAMTLPLVTLIAFPFIYIAFRKPVGDYDMGLDVAFVTIICWSGAIFLGVGLAVRASLPM